MKERRIRHGFLQTGNPAVPILNAFLRLVHHDDVVDLIDFLIGQHQWPFPQLIVCGHPFLPDIGGTFLDERFIKAHPSHLIRTGLPQIETRSDRHA